MQAIFRGAYWLRFWSLLQREDTREIIRSANKALELSLWIFLPKMDRGAIIDSAFDFPYYVCAPFPVYFSALMLRIM
jgi:hypothetical protein